MRKHYITLCQHDNTEVTYSKTSSGIQVTFEKVDIDGLEHTLVLNQEGQILSQNGFDDNEVAYFIDFLSRNIEVILEFANDET